MSTFLKIFGIILLLALGVGSYFKMDGDQKTGDIIIGITVLASAFILMPVFLYHSWKGKNLKDYTLSDENLKKMRERKKDRF